MQVRNRALPAAATRRIALAVIMAVALTFAVHTAPASAITRAEVLKRANHWVTKRVPYSQRGYFQGYRRDCSGFVSMSWKLKKSYTTRTIGAVSKRISKSQLRPGDAILGPGHVAVFGGWANKAKTRYWALEESRSGRPALKRVKSWRAGSRALRYHGIRDVVPKRTVAQVTTTPVQITPAALVLPETTPTALPLSAPFE